MSDRCWWAGDDPLYQKYHDQEWGVPLYNDQKLFEFLTLESMQAGLSWLTILRKRENFREAFANFDPVKVAAFSDKDVMKLMTNAGIVRHQKKIESVIHNARCFLAIQDEWDGFSNYNWSFVNGKPLQNGWHSKDDVPAITETAKAFAKDLKQKGFKFLGPTTVYAHMQATGMVNDHLTSCFRHRQVQGD